MHLVEMHSLRLSKDLRISNVELGINIKHFHEGGFTFHHMKFVTTKGEMFLHHIFALSPTNICHLWSEKSFCNINCFLPLLFFQFVAVFCFFRAYIRKKLLENHHLFFLKHFHDGGFNF